MKKFMQSFWMVSALSVTVVLAQNVTLNSPNNYKRPVFQQKQNTQSGVVVQRLQSESNLGSVHNYKRQGSINVLSESSSLALNAPVLSPPTLNPLLQPGHYKLQFRPLGAAKVVAQREPQPQEPNNDASK